jgi:hypothetical protein
MTRSKGKTARSGMRAPVVIQFAQDLSLCFKMTDY